MLLVGLVLEGMGVGCDEVVRCTGMMVLEEECRPKIRHPGLEDEL